MISNQIREILFRLMNRNRLTSVLLAMVRLTMPNSYLRQMGWFRSVYQGLPVNMDGKPIPWYTYPAISFLGNRISKDMTVFEYGSGNSTLWWSERVSRVVSCEHDLKWYEIMQTKIPNNVEYLYADLVPGGDYSQVIQNYKEEFDIIVIDGRDRVNCIKNSLNSLKTEGLVIWDNSDRNNYLEGYSFLLNNGFKRLDFFGMGPINHVGWCTSVFYKNNNCLEI